MMSLRDSSREHRERCISPEGLMHRRADRTPPASRDAGESVLVPGGVRDAWGACRPWDVTAGVPRPCSASDVAPRTEMRRASAWQYRRFNPAALSWPLGISRGGAVPTGQTFRRWPDRADAFHVITPRASCSRLRAVVLLTRRPLTAPTPAAAGEQTLWLEVHAVLGDAVQGEAQLPHDRRESLLLDPAVALDLRGVPAVDRLLHRQPHRREVQPASGPRRAAFADALRALHHAAGALRQVQPQRLRYARPQLYWPGSPPSSQSTPAVAAPTAVAIRLTTGCCIAGSARSAL